MLSCSFHMLQASELIVSLKTVSSQHDSPCTLRRGLRPPRRHAWYAHSSLMASTHLIILAHARNTRRAIRTHPQRPPYPPLPTSVQNEHTYTRTLALLPVRKTQCRPALRGLAPRRGRFELRRGARAGDARLFVLVAARAAFRERVGARRRGGGTRP